MNGTVYLVFRGLEAGEGSYKVSFSSRTLLELAINLPVSSSWTTAAFAVAKRTNAATTEKALVKRIVYEEIVQRAERAE